MTARRPATKKVGGADGEPELLVPVDQFEESLGDRIALGEELRSREIHSDLELEDVEAAYYTWDEFNVTLLRRSFSTYKVAEAYSSWGPMVGGGQRSFQQKVLEFREDVGAKVRRLRSVKEQLSLYGTQSLPSRSAEPSSSHGSRIFIVHGHHEALKQQVARTVERLTNASPVILHEQPDGGRTIIEKLENYASDVGFAVILLTSDDRGSSATSEDLAPRARQNVVFELGYFLGLLGRSRVAVLFEEGVELPSDMSGVLYTAADAGGAWQLKLARELKAAGIDIDLNRLA